MSIDSLRFAPHFLDLVTAIALRLYKDPDPKSILDTTAQELRKLLNVDRVVIVQIENKTTLKIVSECSKKIDTASKIATFSIDRNIRKWISKSLHTYVIIESGQPLDVGGQKLLNWLKISSGMIAPIHLQKEQQNTHRIASPEAREDFLGFLAVDHNPGSRGWSPIEVFFVQQLAQHLLQSIHQTQMRQFPNRLVESLRDGVVAIDTHYRFQVWNRAMEELTGVPRVQVLGQVIWEVFPFFQKSGEYQCMAAAMQGENVLSRDRTFYAPQSGRTFSFEARYNPLTDISDQIVGCLGVIQDTSQQKQSENRLKTVTSRLSTLIQNLQAGILLEDETRTILLSNAAFCNIFSIPSPPKDLIGQNCSQMAIQSQRMFQDAETAFQRIEKIMGDRVPVMGDEVSLVDGRILERDYIPIFVEGNYRGHLWQYRDISQLKLIQQQLEQARLSAEAANRAKTNFLATMSHEIRTPLNAVIGLAELLASTPLNGEQQEYVNIIRNSSAMLLSLINDILDISKIEAQKLILERQLFDLHHCLQDTLKLMSPLATEKNLKLKFYLSSDIPQYVMGDITRLRQILVNLINNAVKFTHQGHIDVQVSLQKIDMSKNNSVELYFTVRDTGVGIPAEHQTQLFEAFQQLDASITRRYGGTGLGLAICKSLVEAMGGQISVESTPDQGSTFAFTIQVFTAPPEMELPASIPRFPPIFPPPVQTGRSSPLSPVPLKILVVDDMPVNQKVAVKMLENLGYSADRANDGVKAIAALRQTPYDVVLMDIQMPEMDGYQATQTIRAMGSNIHQPWIIAMTAHSQVEDRQQCLQVGMNDYLSKPVLSEDLTAALRRYSRSLDPAVFLQPAQGNPQNPAAVPDASPLLDDAVLEDLCGVVGTERSILADLLQSYRQETQVHLAALWDAIRQADGDLIRRHSHSLRSMSLNLGAISVGNLCRDLEMNYLTQSLEQQVNLCQHIETLLPQVYQALEHHHLLQTYA